MTTLETVSVVDLFTCTFAFFAIAWLYGRQRLRTEYRVLFALYYSCSLLFLVSLPVLLGFTFRVEYPWFLVLFAIKAFCYWAGSLMLFPRVTPWKSVVVILLLEVASLVSLEVSQPLPSANDEAAWAFHIDSTDRDIRKFCIRQYGRIGQLDYLHRYLLQDEDAGVRSAAYKKLWKIRNEDSLPYLADYLAQLPNDLDSQRVCVRYLNSGNAKLRSAAKSWANHHGLAVEAIKSMSEPEKW